MLLPDYVPLAPLPLVITIVSKNCVALRRQYQAELGKFQGWCDDHEVADAECPFTRYILYSNVWFPCLWLQFTYSRALIPHTPFYRLKKSFLYILTLNQVEFQIANFIRIKLNCPGRSHLNECCSYAFSGHSWSWKKSSFMFIVFVASHPSS